MIERLDNNEHILLMYVADELPADDRIEVEQMLAHDASLGRELERLRAARQRIADALAVSDLLDPLPIREEAAVRRVAREIRARFIRPTMRVTEESGFARRGRPSWALAAPAAAAAAAAIVVSVGLWTSFHRGTPGAEHPRTIDPGSVAMGDPQEFGWYQETITPDEEQQREQVALSSVQPRESDGMPQDELSQFMLADDQ